MERVNMPPGITKEQMVEVDRLMEEKYQVPIESMMEHAGLALAKFAVRLKSTSEFMLWQVRATMEAEKLWLLSDSMLGEHQLESLYREVLMNCGELSN